MATVSTGAANFLAGPISYPASVKGVWTTVNNDVGNLATVTSASNLTKPYNSPDANMVWVRVPDNCTRFILRAKCAVAATVTTSPVVFAYGAYCNGDPTSAAAFPSGTTYKRIGVTDPALASAAGLTLTLSTASNNNNIQDATYLYSNETAAFDCLGAAYFSVMVSTKGNVGASEVIPVEVMFLN